MAAADVDLGHLSTHLGVPEPTLTSLATQPTADLVTAVLEAVAAKAREFEVLYSEKLQVDIELENAIRSSEARFEQSKSTADNALKEAGEVRQKLRDEGKRPSSICASIAPRHIIHTLSLQRMLDSLSRTNFRP